MNTVSTTKDRQSESGNVLFLILIAVALFAALSYAVTQSTRSGAGSSDNETSLINSAQLTQYPAGIRTAVVRMMIGGVDIGNLSFNAPSDFTNLGTNLAWGVFYPTGGGATYAEAPVDVMATGPGVWHFNLENQIDLVGTTGGAGPTDTSADLIAFLPGISKSVCTKINSELGLPTADADIAEADALYDVGYTYTNDMVATGGGTPPGVPGTPGGGTINGPATEFSGQPFGCILDGTTYVYYHVLIER